MADLLVEIRTEELPALRVFPAAVALRDGLAARLAEAGLLEGWTAEGQRALGTPRRLAAFIPGVKERQPDREERMWGPPVAAAFGPDGKPTKAGEGFARSSGVPLETMGRGEKTPGKPPYLFADRKVKGRTAAEVIAEVLPAVAGNLPFRRTMRWPQSGVPFARPVRGLVVLLGNEVVPCRFAGLEAGRTTRGHAFLAPGGFPIPSADLRSYCDSLSAAKVIVDFKERKEAVWKAVADLRGRPVGIAFPGEEDLLEEVTGLVEWPSTVEGSFDPKYRRLPGPLLVTAMAHHLRFFPVLDDGRRVQNRFVSVTDRDAAAADAIRPGNERVLGARLYDADFFFGNDRKRRLADFRPGLAGMDFHRGLGTLLDKSERVQRIVEVLCGGLGFPEDLVVKANRAAFLLKCDLLTEVVKEFPELQGVIGGGYALDDGEDSSVALALEGQYLPRGEWDVVLDDGVAAAVSLAEKADSLAAYFSIGEEPTGTADPYGLRRHALGLLRILAKKEWPLSIEAALAPACAEWKLENEVRARLVSFVWGRADQTARSSGFTDFVDAVGVLTARPCFEHRVRLAALQDLSRRPTWRDLVALVERTGNMGEAGRPALTSALPPEVRAVEAAHGQTLAMAKKTPDPVAFAERYLDLLGAPVNEMFEKVLVDDPKEPARRAAIKSLLHDVFVLFADRLGDLRKLGSGAKPPRA